MSLKGRISIVHLVAFWLGTQFIVAGVAFHLPDFIASRHTHFCMQCMRMSPLMLTGMGLILTGIFMAAYGLFPVKSETKVDQTSDYQLQEARHPGICPAGHETGIRRQRLDCITAAFDCLDRHHRWLGFVGHPGRQIRTAQFHSPGLFDFCKHEHLRDDARVQMEPLHVLYHGTFSRRVIAYRLCPAG
jgi:hypothetical protein